MLNGRDVLLDAGPLIAMLDVKDQWHDTVMPVWRAMLPRCLTTEPVLVEATHILARRLHSHTRALEFLIASEVPVFALHLPLHQQCVHLMQRYADVPMDYADATLVALADRIRLQQVFTLDRKGFRTYRTSRGMTLEIVPLTS
jgi:predicted nucleic acid-binding protein